MSIPQWTEHRHDLSRCSVWPTVTAWIARRPSQMTCTAAPRHAGKVSREITNAVAERGGEGHPINPDWVEWLMGFPIGWTEVDR